MPVTLEQVGVLVILTMWLAATAFIMRRICLDPNVETWRARYHRVRAETAEMEADAARYRQGLAVRTFGRASTSGRRYGQRAGRWPRRRRL